MKLDVVIPVLNEEYNLNKLLPFLYSTPNRNYINIIVVDAESSSDNSPLVCQNNNVTYMKSGFTRRSKQMNEGAKQMKGDCIMFLHADVEPPNNFYESIKDSLDNGFEAGCFSYQFDSKSFMLKINSLFTKQKNIFSGGGDQIQFITRNTFEELGGYCEQHDIMEDFEFFSRIKKHKIPYTIINSPAKVSARKYKNNSWLKVNLINLAAIMHYKVNHDPVKVKSFYNRWLS